MTSRLLHVSDVHLGPAETVPGVDPDRRLTELLGEVVDRGLPVDGCLVTGDLTDAGEPEGYERLAALLRACPWPARVVPGNHDDVEVGRRILGPDLWPGTDAWAWALPGGAVVVGVSSVVAGHHHGEIAAPTLDALDRVAAGLSAERPWVLACHHPPVDVGHWWMDAQSILSRADGLRRIARERGALAILCGHLHLTTSVWSPGDVPVLSAPSTVHEVVLDGGERRPLRFRAQRARALHHALGPGRLTTVEVTTGGPPRLVPTGDWAAERDRTDRRGPVPR